MHPCSKDPEARSSGHVCLVNGDVHENTEIERNDLI